jgi:hypothetical protein
LASPAPPSAQANSTTGRREQQAGHAGIGEARQAAHETRVHQAAEEQRV